MVLAVFAFDVVNGHYPSRLTTTRSTASHLGQLLKTTRKRYKITQAELAGHIEISQNGLSHLGNHPEELSVKQLLSWCPALELDLKPGERDMSAAGRVLVENIYISQECCNNKTKI